MSESLVQRTTEWLDARKGKLTASNMGAILGLVSSVSQPTALKRALGTDSFTGNAATDWGNNNEANGIAAYEQLTGMKVELTGLHTHKDFEFIAGSPDGLIGDEGLIEIKCPYYFPWSGVGRIHSKVPLHYYVQMNVLLEITQRKWCDYVCWTPEGVSIFRVTCDPVCFKQCLPYYHKFLKAMQTNDPKLLRSYSAERARLKEVVNSSMLKHVHFKMRIDTKLQKSYPDHDPFENLDD
eukprot:6205706-Pleurochrysis_carterae.AAC.3